MTVLMDPAVRDKWIAALTSGKYAQGTGMLHPRFDLHCCLGVLCEVAVKDGAIDKYEGTEPLPPDPVIAWAGMAFEDAQMCVGWNDDDRLSFAEIAARLA